MVFVSRRAGFPVAGSVVASHVSRLASGLSPVPDGLKFVVSGSVSGNCSSGRGFGSPSTQMIGNGSPQ